MTKDVLHYDTVGSFLRPEKLKQARQEFLENKISREKLKLVENEAIADLVEKEKQLGLKVVTDGEFRRSYWHLDTFGDLVGLNIPFQNMDTFSMVKKQEQIQQQFQENSLCRKSS